jgi:hypothetical protein
VLVRRSQTGSFTEGPGVFSFAGPLVRNLFLDGQLATGIAFMGAPYKGGMYIKKKNDRSFFIKRAVIGCIFSCQSSVNQS